jgi:hypothetical protein
MDAVSTTFIHPVSCRLWACAEQNADCWYSLCMVQEAINVLSRGPAAYLAQGAFVLPVAGWQSEQRCRQAQQRVFVYSEQDAGEVCLELTKAAVILC